MPVFVGTFGSEDSSELSSYGSQLAKLLPPGPRLWNLEQDSSLKAMLDAIGDEFERVRVQGLDLIEESDPRTATATLDYWEDTIGLPDERVLSIPGTDAERRVAITQKLVSRGGQNYAFFETLSAACGYPLLSIDKFAESVLRAGFRVSDRVYGAEWAYSMRLNLDTATAGALSHADFERVIRHATHSHIQVSFTYV